LSILDGHHLHVSLLLLVVVLIISIIVNRDLHRVIIKLLLLVGNVAHLLLHNRVHINVEVHCGVRGSVARVPLLFSAGS
jgi:hypothetical protein